MRTNPTGLQSWRFQSGPSNDAFTPFTFRAALGPRPGLGLPITGSRDAGRP